MLANIILISGSFNFLHLVWFKKEALRRFFELLIKVPRSHTGDSSYTFYVRLQPINLKTLEGLNC